MTGCTYDDDTLETKGTIRFRVSDEWIQGTRTLANSDNDLQAKPFCVLGKYSAGDTYAATNTVFDNQEVSYTDASGWDYNPKKNWEKSSTYRFCAYWPSTAGVTLSGDMETGLTIEGYSVAQEYANQVDLLLSNVVQVTTGADPRNDPEPMVTNGITLNFHHLLCNINFSIQKSRGTQADIKVTNIRMGNVKNTGTFTQSTFTNLSTNWNTGTWSNVSGRSNYNSGSISQDITTDYSTISNWGGFVAIPQSIGSDEVTLTVEYSSTPQGGTATVRRVDLTLPASTIETAWQMNKRITYKLEINEDNSIKFGKPTVESWGTAQASGTIIIK